MKTENDISELQNFSNEMEMNLTGIQEDEDSIDQQLQFTKDKLGMIKDDIDVNSEVFEKDSNQVNLNEEVRSK
jgi:hypothetical protein